MEVDKADKVVKVIHILTEYDDAIHVLNSIQNIFIALINISPKATYHVLNNFF
jgi:hypothetical protein